MSNDLGLKKEDGYWDGLSGKDDGRQNWSEDKERRSLKRFIFETIKGRERVRF